MGRQWLYREISEHLTSELPTNRGVIVTGNPATGKTAAILQLVENRCVCLFAVLLRFVSSHYKLQKGCRSLPKCKFFFVAVASGGEVGIATEISPRDSSPRMSTLSTATLSSASDCSTKPSSTPANSR